MTEWWSHDHKPSPHGGGGQGMTDATLWILAKGANRARAVSRALSRKAYDPRSAQSADESDRVPLVASGLQRISRIVRRRQAPCELGCGSDRRPRGREVCHPGKVTLVPLGMNWYRSC
jgi:hypothetical protein